MGKHKSQRPKDRETKLSLNAFSLRQFPVLASATVPLPRLKSLPAPKIKRDSLFDASVTAAEYVRDYPTPFEAFACKAFEGLCLECQMIFAGWKHPTQGMVACHTRKSAHHSFEDLEHCWCPLCKMLLSNLLRYNKAPLQELRLSENYIRKTDVNVFHHRRSVPCYYVELVFDTGHRRLKPYFMMFPDSELYLPTRRLGALFDTKKGQNMQPLSGLYNLLRTVNTYGTLRINGLTIANISIQTVRHLMRSGPYQHDC
jgi:hypothetical protein